jgi:glycosyltransferase involved in cell wall biosynthesis
VHTPHGVRFADPRVGPAALAELIVERLLARATERVVALSPSERLILEKAYLAAQITVIPNALEATIEPVAPFPHPPRIVSVGRLEHEKSPEVVVQVFALVRRRRPDTEALIVGNGSRAARVESAIAKLDPAIRLVRAGLPGRDVIATATAVLVASRREGGPLVPLEAMERGRPVVATDVVGCRDVVRHGLTGYLAPLGDAHLLAHRLLDLIEDPVKAQAMGAVGRQVLLREYSLAASAEKLIRLYQAVVA